MCSAEANGPVGGKNGYRVEHDLLGMREIPQDALTGIHTLRAVENFPLMQIPVHRELVHAFGMVKLAAHRTNRSLGAWENRNSLADAVEQACMEMSSGLLDEYIVVDSLQGGAGTSTNMNVNEVLANRALVHAGHSPGDYSLLSPLDDINMHQSTNDVYPTALRCAAITLIRRLETSVVSLQEAFQQKEKAFAHIVKIARTQLQDAVLITLGREMSAFADAVGRDRWRIYKCEERLRVVNLGGTAVGTGIAAPREYIFRVVDTLREITGIGFARAENLVDATQNADAFVEVSGILKALAATLIKICTDLRLLSSGPQSGFGEITLPAMQAGSSIMPDKINPVIPEAVTQAAIRVIGNDLQITMAAASGNLELSQFMPLIADALLNSIDLLTRGCELLRTHCVEGIAANEEQCRMHTRTCTAAATALVDTVGYDKSEEIVEDYRTHGGSLRDAAVRTGYLTPQQYDELVAPEAVMRLGSVGKRRTI